MSTVVSNKSGKKTMCIINRKLSKEFVLICLIFSLLAVPVAYSATYVTNSKALFDDGAYNKTEWNLSMSFVGLAANDTLQELPNNNGNDGWVNMAGNFLLMHMNEQAGTITDTSGSGNNGTQSGGVTYSASGKLNTALDFDGVNDYVGIPSSDLGLFTNGFTISAWVYIKEDALGGIITKMDTSSPINANREFGFYLGRPMSRPHNKIQNK